MPEFLFSLHSGVRYLVLLAGVLAVVLAVLTGSRPATRPLRMAWKSFVGVVDLQVLIGLLVLTTRPFQAQTIGHLTMMLAALLVGHGVSIAYRRRPADRQTGGMLLGSVLLMLALIVGGILAIGRPVL